MPFLRFEDISKSFFGVQVLHGISFELERGKLLGLVGENGSGKSTSMNILGGVHRPDSGRMHLNGQVFAPSGPRDAIHNRISFIHQELNLFPNLSIEENLFVRDFPRLNPFVPVIDRKKIRARTEQLLDMVDLKVSPKLLVSRLSQGERQLVEIAKALSTEAQLIIFDEPTTSLTRTEIDRLFTIIERLRTQGIAIIYISHILEDVLRLADQIVVLRDGRLVGQGPRPEFTIDRLISMMVGRSISQLFPTRQQPSATVPIVEVDGLTQPGIIKDVSFTVHKGEILGLAGLMGAGRSETARIIFGLDPCRSGEVRVDGKRLERLSPDTAMDAGIVFLTEDRRADGLLMSAPIYDTEALPNLARFANQAGWVNGSGLQQLAVDQSRRVQLSTLDINQVPVRNLSGGNQQKVVLAKWLMRKPRVFILDEPTRGVDIGAKAEIYKLISQLAADGCCVLLISSEMEELLGMCDRIAVMHRGEITEVLDRSEFSQERILQAAMGQGRPEAAE